MDPKKTDDKIVDKTVKVTIITMIEELKKNT